MAASPRDGASQYVDRTMRALELLVTAGRSQAQLARELGVHRRTARRLLHRLVELGYAEPDLTNPGDYVATARIIGMGREVANRLDAIGLARDGLRRLEHPAIACSVVAVLRENSIVTPVVLTCDPAIHPAWLRQVAQASPLHATAVGKAFLMDNTLLLEWTLAKDRPAYTDRTTTERADLLVDVAAARRRGFAHEHEEFTRHRWAVASPVLDYAESVALVVGAMTTDPHAVDELGQEIAQVARTLSTHLGSAEPTTGGQNGYVERASLR